MQKDQPSDWNDKEWFGKGWERKTKPSNLDMIIKVISETLKGTSR